MHTDIIVTTQTVYPNPHNNIPPPTNEHVLVNSFASSDPESPYLTFVWGIPILPLEDISQYMLEEMKP
jgi:hypothetical protein